MNEISRLVCDDISEPLLGLDDARGEELIRRSGLFDAGLFNARNLIA